LFAPYSRSAKLEIDNGTNCRNRELTLINANEKHVPLRELSFL